MNTKIEQLKEYAKILKDTPYALKTYLQTYDNTQRKYVPLELFPDQITLINDYESHNENITKKYRQAGVSTVTAAWISKVLQTANPEKPEKVLIVANKRDTAIEMANKIRGFLDQWPSWVNVGFSQDKNSESRFKLKNGCEVKAVATSKDALRGYTPTILIFDEAAYIEAGEDFWAASMASLSCVHEDSYVLTSNGLVQLKDLISEKEKIGFTEYNGDLKVVNHVGEISDIKSTFKSEKSTCYKIRTKSGHELIGSYKHPLMVNKDGEDDWVWMENLKPDDKIKFRYNQNVFGVDEPVHLEPQHYHGILKRPLIKNLSDDLDMVYLMGVFLTKGSCYQKKLRTAGFNDRINQFLLDFGFTKGPDFFYYCSAHITRFFQNTIGLNVTSIDNKKIPNIILQASREVQVSFLRGLFDVNGWGYDDGVRFTTQSHELATQVQSMLLNFGIETLTWSSDNIPSVNPKVKLKTYKVFIKSSDVLKFHNDIGFRFNDGKKDKIDNLPIKTETTFYDEILEIETFEDYTYDLQVPNGHSFISNGFMSHNTGGKIILISTPNSFDPIYYAVYNQAVHGLNDFKITDLKWYNDPRYSKDLKWVKVSDMVHYMLNREQYDDDKVCLYDVDPETYDDLFGQGYKPYSSWYEGMAKKLKYDRRKISQEIECDFLGSGDNVISSEIRDKILKEMVKEPVEKFMTGQLWQWKPPIAGHRYILSLDVSRGDSEDFSSMNIIDFDDKEQVVEYIGKIPPDSLAEVGYKWGQFYEAFIVIDITGGMGIATARKLQEMGYKNLYVDGTTSHNTWDYSRKSEEKIPGLNFNNKRTQIVAAFEEQIRHGFIIRSQRLVNEMNTFVFINGRPDHMKGSHDDSIMSIAMAMYVGDIRFTQLTKNVEKNKAMMEAWTVSERSYDPKKSFYSYGQAFDPLGAIDPNTGRPVPNPLFQNDQMTHGREAYEQYSWLFGKKK